MSRSTRLWGCLLAHIALALSQGQQCYWAAGPDYRAPENVIPCNNDGPSSCCMAGDTCLAGNACWNFDTGDVYQYGCTDINYEDSTCPYKCGWDPNKSPWTALEYCDEDGVDNTWICHSPESCGCDWEPTYDLLVLPLRGCSAMGKNARVALYAPDALAPWALLPNGTLTTTAYFKTYTTDGTVTWTSTAVAGYTPTSIGPYQKFATPAPTNAVVLFPGSSPAPSQGTAHLPDVTGTPAPISGLPSTSSSASSSFPITSSTNTKSTQARSHTASSTLSSTSPTATSSPVLSTGAKVGIGVGVAGGVCFLAALALAFIMYRRRNKQNRTSASRGPDEKFSSWQGQPYPPGGSPHGYHYNQSYQYQGVPAMIHEATYSPEDEETIQKRLSPPQPFPQPLAEMEGGHTFPEADSRTSSRPRQNYDGADLAKQLSQSSRTMSH